MTPKAPAWMTPFLLGFLTLAAQTLLLRRFLWRMEATGIGVGIFLSAWLAWIGIGALVARTRPGERLVAALAARLPVALLLYLPLAGIQFLLLDHLRELAGVPEYLASPVWHLALGALIANAPVSFGTGFLFPAAARWFTARGGNAARAYALDAAGAVAAGILVTTLLAVGVRLEGGHQRDWQRLFPGSKPAGSFATPAATYLYGAQGGTFYVLSAGGVVDALPEAELSANVAALLLSQKPEACRVLLLGRVPLAMVLALREFQPQAQITWCHDDPAYAREILKRLPELCGPSLPACVTKSGPQAFLRDPASRVEQFDLALIWPASPSVPGGAALLEREFLQQVRAAVKPDGVVALPLGGGPGAWSLEQRRLATAIRANALATWPMHGLLAPGAGCWWLASGKPLADAATAATRFGQLGVKRFPSAAIAELYDPPRAAELRQISEPRGAADKIIRHGLALAWRAEWPAWPMARWIDWAGAHGGLALLLLAMGALWLAPTAGGARKKAAAHLAVAWLAAGGFLGLTGLLALLQLLEVRFGNLYLLTGLAGSLFLAGMVAGNRMAEQWLRGTQWLNAAAIAHGALLLLLLPLAAHTDSSGAAVVVLGCLVAGVPAGWWVPLAITRLRQAGVPDEEHGAAVLRGDALGSALGGLATSLLLLPWLDRQLTCLAVAVFAAAIGCCAAVPRRSARLVARIALLLCLGASGVLLAIGSSFGGFLLRQGYGGQADRSTSLTASGPALPGGVRNNGHTISEKYPAEIRH